MTISRHIAIATALTAVACIYYLGLITDGTFNPFGNELLGLVFNDMAARLVRGDITIDRAIVLDEAYLRNGQTLAYWGIFPALLRLPLLATGLIYDLQIARLSCWIATCLSAALLVATYVRILRRSPHSPRAVVLFHCLVLSTLFAGALLTSLGSAYIYNEPLFWAVALNLAFNAIVLNRLLGADPLRPRDLLALALMAGLSLNCRALEGIALYLAMGFVLLVVLLREGFLKTLAPGLVLAFFLALCGTVNTLRWGSPLTFVDLHFHVQIIGNAERLAVLDKFGPIHPIRLPISFAYYMLGTPLLEELKSIWPNAADLYDGIEGPLSAFPLTATLVLVLAVLGAIHMLRRQSLRTPGGMMLAAVLGAELVGIGLLLSAEYLAMRYRLDFLPVMSFAAAVGFFSLANAGDVPRLSNRLAIGLTAVSIVASHLSLIAYKEYLLPFKAEAARGWQDFQSKRAIRPPPSAR